MVLYIITSTEFNMVAAINIAFGFIGLAIIALCVYAEFFDSATPRHKFVTPEEMR
jgi:hypothetical protein